MIQMIHALLNNRNDGPFSIQMASNVDNSDEEGPLYMLYICILCYILPTLTQCLKDFN